MESQFVLVGITNDTTKYHHILAALPEDIAINLPMEIENYSSLKDSITQVYQKSKTELIEEALETITLDGQKPSVCLLRIQRKLAECHLTMDNDVIKHCFMQAMPISLRSSFSAHLDLRPDKLVKLADTQYSYSKTIFKKTRTFTPQSNPRHCRLHASCSHSKETAQPTTVCSHSHLVNDPKFAAFTCFPLTTPNGVSPGVSSLGRSPHTSNCHLVHNHLSHRETNSPTRVSGNV